MEAAVGVFSSSPSCTVSQWCCMLETQAQASSVLLALNAKFPLASVGACTYLVVIRGDRIGLSDVCIASSNGAYFTLFFVVILSI